MFIFQPLRKFDEQNLHDAPDKPGVYIIYVETEDGPIPYYVGRSSVSMKERLIAHANGTGSRKVAEILGYFLLFECQEMHSEFQAEAQLIKLLETRGHGNLRFETDPADRY